MSGVHPWRLVATCSLGLEDVVADELSRLGLGPTEAARGAVRFGGGRDAVYRANLWLRAAMRVLIELSSGEVAGRDDLYDLASGVAWEDWLVRGQTIVVSAAGASPAFRSSAFAALVVKDAVVDRLRARWGVRPDVARDDADLRIVVHLGGGDASVAVDTSGEPLSHRGYRPRGGPAPLSEALAAGILLLAGVDGSAPFLDPMCGTGTLAIEAAMIATASAPGAGRAFACERAPWHAPEQLARRRAEARSGRRPASAPVLASDRDPRAVAATRANAAHAGMGEVVQVRRADASALEPPPGAVIVTNPPYGRRLGEITALPPLYRELGDALKRRAAGCTAWVLAGEPELAKLIGLRPARRIRLFNGPIECRLLRFDLFEGSRRGRRPSPGQP